MRRNSELHPHSLPPHFLEQCHAEQYPYYHADEDEEPVHEPCARLGFFVKVLVKVVFEEQIDGRHRGACQQ